MSQTLPTQTIVPNKVARDCARKRWQPQKAWRAALNWASHQHMSHIMEQKENPMACDNNLVALKNAAQGEGF